MKIPIYIDGAREGELTIERQGALTVMDARLRDVGRLVRLRVFGEREAYLGVPAPSGGEMRLVKRLTPNDMRPFPQKPEYAAEERMDAEQPQKPETPAPEPRRGHVLWQGGRPYYF